MTKNQKTILLAVISLLAMLIVVIVAAGVWVATSMFDNTEMSDASATGTMDDVRARFGGAAPVLDLQPQGIALSRRPPDTRPSGELKTLHILRWNQEEQRLTRVELPFWLLRLRDSPIQVALDNGDGAIRTKTSMSIRVSDIERFGPALLLDGPLPDGGHVLAWSD